MIFAPFQYQVCFFADLSDLNATPAITANFIEIFQAQELLPNVYQEIAVPNPPVPRLQMASTDGDWVIQIEGNRINIVKRPLALDGSSMGDLATFVSDAGDMVTNVLEQYPKRGSRLSLVTTHLSEELSDSEWTETYAKFVNPLTFYHENTPSDWNVRQTARVERRIDGNSEFINTITSIGRVSGTFHRSLTETSTEFDRLRVMFDINTHQGNQETRFTAEDVPRFCETAITLRNSIMEQTGATVDG